MAGADDRGKDELAVTATAPGTAKQADAPAVAGTLGRYRLERELGAGGMGVVHAAFDPDLERRVALKVLRATDGGGEARQRLLREARALARVTHTNVVTVHEVGSASGRDFVAMELVDGETLADWLKSAPRTPDEIIATFIAAGRGLAAAHAAGLVHRDFKPHNVLRRKDGRIVVTDFGLARGVEAVDRSIELEATMRPQGNQENTPSSLTGLTQTGSVLGTPAYMAPEQWTGGSIGPPADQFAFCVALWEALTGARPYGGATIEALKAEVARGPDALDASKLPRRLRETLRRGLASDPKQRWPSMDALLAQLSRTQRRPRRIALVLASGAVVAAAIGYVALREDKPAAVAACAAPALAPDRVWSPSIARALAVSPDVKRVLDQQFTRWSSARQAACTAANTKQLTCLDGVLARFDAVRKSTTLRANASLDDAGLQLVDPAVCNVADPPRLPGKLSDAAALGLALSHQPEPGGKFDLAAQQAALAKVGDDACARALTLLVRAARDEGVPARDAAEEAAQAADACGDDRTRADALLEALSADITTFLPKVPKSLAVAEAAIRKVAEPVLQGRLDLLKADIAQTGGQFDEMLRLAETAIKEFGDDLPRQHMRAVVMKLRALSNRNKPGDQQMVRTEAQRWRAVAERAHMPLVVTAFDTLDCDAQWQLGDVAGAHARFADLRARINAESLSMSNNAPEGGVTIHGLVVDTAGKPVAGALVIADIAIAADSVGIGMLRQRGEHVTTTDAKGAFTLEHVQEAAVILSQLGDKRSLPRHIKDGDKLVLQPTTTIAGRVDEHSPDRSMVFALADGSSMYQMVAPIRSDGTFTLSGVPLGKLRVGAISRSGSAVGQSIAMQVITVGPTGNANIEIKRTDTRKLRVVVRSKSAVPLSGAMVFVMTGKVTSIKTVKDTDQILRSPGVAVEQARALSGETPPELHLLAGDLVATFASAPTGTATACALGLFGDLSDQHLMEKISKHRDQVPVGCTPVTSDANVVTLEVPPLPRLD